MKGFEIKSGNMTMNELITMSKELQGLRSVRLTDDGNFVYVVPKQIIREGKNEYLGLPELVMAEEFANIPVTLDKDYANHKMVDIPAELRGVFNYDLSKHLIINLLDFRAKIADPDWLKEQTDEVKERLLKSKYYMIEDGQVVLKQKALLVNATMTEGSIINHIDSYNTELVFYADPQISYKLEPEDKMRSCSVFYRVESEDEAKALGVEKGTSIQTPWMKFINHYNSAFNKIYMNPIREKYPNATNADFKKLPEVEEANKKKLVTNPNYLVTFLVNRINTSVRDEIEVESGEEIPTFLNTIQMKSYQFEKYFKFSKESDVHFEPSAAIMKITVPKREGNSGLDYKKQYDGIKVNKPEITIKNNLNGTDNRVPNMHPNDPTWSKRMKEELLNFPFKQAYVTSNSKGFGQSLKFSAIYEIIRNIALPIYQMLPEGEYAKDNMKEFLVNDIKVPVDELEKKIASTDAQFAGMPAVGGVVQQPTVPVTPVAPVVDAENQQPVAPTVPTPPVPPIPGM